MITPESLKKVSMLSDFETTELAGICGCFTEESIAPGETLYVEGDPATSACFLINGELEALKALPGGGAAQIAVIKPGSMIGEMALVVGGTRTATVRATMQSTVLTMLPDHFHAALDQVSVPAYKILRSVVHNVAVRLDELQERVLEQWDCDAWIAPPHIAESGPRFTAEIGAQLKSFDFHRFLPVVPFFAPFTQSEIDRLVASAKVVELARGEYLYREATSAECCYVVVQGAIETSVMRDRRYQLSILGPGRICGANSLITNRLRTSDARARSAVLLLAFDRSCFHRLFSDDSSEGLKFQRMISQNQLQDRKVAHNLLSTLVSRDCISSGTIRHRP